MKTSLLVVLFLPVYAAAPLSDVSTGDQGDTAIHEHNHAHEDGPEAESKERLRLLFKTIDVNRDGIMDAKELIGVCLANNINIEEAEAERAVTLSDKTVGLTMDMFVELLAHCPSSKTEDIIFFFLHGDRRGRFIVNPFGVNFQQWPRNFLNAALHKLYAVCATDAVNLEVCYCMNEGVEEVGEVCSAGQGCNYDGTCLAVCAADSVNRDACFCGNAQGGTACTAGQRCSSDGICLNAIDGGWTSYGSCTKTCKGGVKKRTCTNPSPQHGGKPCDGDGLVPCNQNIDCAIDGGWTSYGSCTKICKGGVKKRTCTNPSPQHGGKPCAGDASVPCNQNIDCVTCSGGATLLSTSPGQDMVVCKDKTESTCEKDFETLCPAGWNLCTPKQFNNRNDGWNYNWKDDNAGNPLGVIYCKGGVRLGAAYHYYISTNAVLNTDQQLNCVVSSIRPGCERYARLGWDCDNKGLSSALCCAPTSTCGDGRVQQEEDCDDGNDSNMDDCLNSCTWKNPGKHGLSGC